MKRKLGSSDFLAEHEDNWVTSLGAWFPGEKVILRGKDLLNELGDRSWMDIWFLSVTGREFTQRQMDLWNGLWVLCSSFPDPRLWNNRVAALTGNAKSTSSLAIAGSTAISEATTYGRQADYKSYNFITSFLKDIEQGADLDEELTSLLKVKRIIPPGFGRPIVKVDERIPQIIRLVENLEFDQLPHFKLALAIDTYFAKSRYKFRLNAGGMAAAISADQGLSLQEYYRASTLVFSAGNIACYCDALDHEEGTFFPLPCSRISYEGKAERKWET